MIFVTYQTLVISSTEHDVLGLVMALALPTIVMGSVDSAQPVVVCDIRLIYFLSLK